MTCDRTPSPAGFRANASGAASVEFAFIAPLMILLMVGIVDAGTLLLKYRHAFQAAASLAETGSRLSIADRTGSSGAQNPITQEQAALLDNGVKLIMGNNIQGIRASAQRVIRSAGAIKPEWAWVNNSGSRSGGQAAVNQAEVLALTRDGESLLVADVTFEHKFLFGILGAKMNLTAHYAAGVPSY